VAQMICLLGPPAIQRDGRPARPPRGRKAWALLAYLLLADRPPSRRHLAELLFADADDPLGALRWSLAELRLRYRLEAPGVPADRLAALVDWAERHSPVSTAARRELPVAVEVDLADAPPGG
jgi:hypothetical protein